MAVTPKVFAGYAKHLYVVDDKFKKPGEYKLEVRMPKGDPEVEKFVKLFDEYKDSAYPPIKDGDKVKSNSDKRMDFARGHWLVRFKTTRAPTLVDSKKQPLKTEISGGDVVKVAYNAKPYEAPFGSGVTLYLNAVQLIEKRGGGGVADFEEEEGFVDERVVADEFETVDGGDF